MNRILLDIGYWLLLLLDIVRIFLTLITSNFWVAKINVAHEYLMAKINPKMIVDCMAQNFDDRKFLTMVIN